MTLFVTAASVAAHLSRTSLK